MRATLQARIIHKTAFRLRPVMPIHAIVLTFQFRDAPARSTPSPSIDAAFGGAFEH